MDVSQKQRPSLQGMKKQILWILYMLPRFLPGLKKDTVS